MKKIIVYILCLMLVVSCLSGCRQETETTERSTEKVTKETGSEVTTKNEADEVTAAEATTGIPSTENDGAVSIDPSTNPSTLDSFVLDDLTNQAIANMTLEEKIGQLFIVNIELLDPADPKSYDYQEITKRMKKSLKNYEPGGLIFFARNIKERKQTIKFIRNLQKASEIPLFIAVDEEGGEIARIGNNKKMKTTKFPTMSEIGATNDPAKALEVGTTIGAEIKELGFNLDFAPIADIDTNPDSPEIGTRSFGTTAELVASMVPEVVKGLQSQGVSSTLKHFPGHGDAEGDTHKGYANITQDIKRLRKVEFLPFKAGIEAGVDLIMVSHLAVSNVTGKDVPCSMSSLVITDILRSELGYQNLVITDALNMKAITSSYSAGDAAVTAIKAGADILLMPENLEEAYDALALAVATGKIEEKRIDQSAALVIKTKIRRGVIPLDSPLLTNQSTKETE